ncbi:MAG: 3-hydroxybutyrate oligomer hydrolase family protein [Sulfobacillus sp.]
MRVLSACMQIVAMNPFRDSMNEILGRIRMRFSVRAAPAAEFNAQLDFLVSPVRETRHDAGDDLLTAGLGRAGLRGAPVAFIHPAQPTSGEVRRRAIQMSWKGIAWLRAHAAVDTYGALAPVPGREYGAFARAPGVHDSHRVLAQIPDHFDHRARCLLVAPASGSRGVYGAIAVAGAWGLPRGCAVVYTDKAGGSGYFDSASNTGVALDGTRAQAGSTPLEFEPGSPLAGRDAVGVKQAHSADNTEADWGRHTLQAARFGLAMLERAFPAEAPFTPRNTRIIAVGISNGGGAVLQAAASDDLHLLSGVVAGEPNIHVEGGRPLYDYATEAALWLPCALLDPHFDSAPGARGNALLTASGAARCATLKAQGRLAGSSLPEQARNAWEYLRAQGWSEGALRSAAICTAFDLWRSVAVLYAAAYARGGSAPMPCGYHYAALDGHGQPTPATASVRAQWWPDAAGVPPGNGVGIIDTRQSPPDLHAPGLVCLRALWTGADALAQRLRAGVAATRGGMPRAGLPVLLVHGAEDGLIPAAFSSAPYVAAARAAGLPVREWRVSPAQHFDAFLALPGFAQQYVPLVPYVHAALDALWAHLAQGKALPDDAEIRAVPGLPPTPANLRLPQ